MTLVRPLRAGSNPAGGRYQKTWRIDGPRHSFSLILHEPRPKELFAFFARQGSLGLPRSVNSVFRDKSKGPGCQQISPKAVAPRCLLKSRSTEAASERTHC